MDELRIVLLGKQGAGKSTSGNTLLCKQLFNTAASSERVTQACSSHSSMSIEGKPTMKVIDTPGWCDSSQSETDIKQEIIKCIHVSSPGPHVFLLVLPIGRFTNEEINTIMNILKEFGDEVTKYMIVLFTKGDDLEEKPIEDYLKEVHSDLKKIIQLCGGRYHVFNNRDKKNNNQVSSLLEKIHKMVESNEEKYYTTTMYQKGKEQIDDRRRQQHDTKAVCEKRKTPAESENGSRSHGCDAGEDCEERGDISEDKSNEENMKLKTTQQQNSSENRSRSHGCDAGEDCEERGDISEEYLKWKMTQEKNIGENSDKDHGGLQEKEREEGKRNLNYRNEDDKTTRNSYGADGNRNVDVNVDKLSMRIEIERFGENVERFIKILKKLEMEWFKEKVFFTRYQNELQTELKKKEVENNKIKEELQLLKDKENRYKQEKQVKKQN